MLAVLQSLAGRKPTPPTLRYSHYGTNSEVICINQDVPTCFYAVQRRRLPIVAMLLDRGLSDTNTGEVNQLYIITEMMKYFGKNNVSFSPRIPYGKQATSHAPKSETWDECCFS
jgi:hypothetical protein